MAEVAHHTIAVRTRWLDADDDLAEALAEHLPPLRHDDTVVVSEKVVILLTGGAVPIEAIRVGQVTRLLARAVRPRKGSRGLSVPEKMQYVVNRTGWRRVLVAALCSAATRPFGRRGDFYRVAGPLARDIDGARPPYEHLLLPPLPASTAAQICDRLQARLGVGLAIVDVNDFGGSIRATSSRALPAERLLRVLADNPLGQRLQGTPFGIVRRSTATNAHKRVGDADIEPNDDSASEGAGVAGRPAA